MQLVFAHSFYARDHHVLWYAKIHTANENGDVLLPDGELVDTGSSSQPSCAEAARLWSSECERERERKCARPRQPPPPPPPPPPAPSPTTRRLPEEGRRDGGRRG
ncbi:hypothetical protein HZH66_015340 [Vespula vulgaris]|uniref:Uncharacterized protein n=1 Tax=Vespula vulgaris TaxID=7454 RepID=A0A834IW16_VESVU|nr:hypothetical protein HZH66_015340 [Vespula vulgaris]